MGQAKRRGSREERVAAATSLKNAGVETDYWKTKRETKARKSMMTVFREALKKRQDELLGRKPGFRPSKWTPQINIVNAKNAAGRMALDSADMPSSYILSDVAPLQPDIVLMESPELTVPLPSN